MQNEELKDCLRPFIALCKRFDLKITPQRCAIYKELGKAKNHPTADEMYHAVKNEFPNISYDTVNRTLLTFAEIGLVDVVPTKGGARRFDPVTDQHHHFHCISCGKIVDFESDEFDNLEIPAHIQDNYDVYTQRVVLNGLCSDCRNKGLHKDRKMAIKNKKMNKENEQ